MRKTMLIFTAMLAIASIGFVGVAKADTITQGGVSYTFTNSGTNGSDFLVTVQIDATGVASTDPNVGDTLTVFAIQVADGGSNLTDASLVSGPAGWTFGGFGNVNQCGTATKPPFVCAVGPGLAVGGAGDVYTFVFDVAGLPGAPTAGDIQAFQGDGDLAISAGVGIGNTPVPTPEPGALTLLGAGFLGLALLAGRRTLTA